MENNTAIIVDNISKLFRLTAQQGSLRDAFGFTLNRMLKRKTDTYKTHIWALKDVSFTVKKGEALGIVGPNGAGKTTMLKILSKVTQPTNGHVSTNGRLSGLIELGAGFHPDLTGRENIFLNGTILGLRHQEIKQKFDSIVDFSGLGRFMDTPVKRYSSGMYVRLGFAVAAHTNPDILLVDEVLAVGDAEFRLKCVERIAELREKGVSIVFISHNLFQVQSVCERGIFLLDGKIQEIGSAIDAIEAYESWIRLRQHMKLTRQKGDFDDSHTDRDVEIEDIRFFDLSGQPKTQFSYQEPVELRVEISTNKFIQGPNIIIQIIRSDGVECAVYRTADHGDSLHDIMGHVYLSLRLKEFQLTSGIYAIEIQLRDNSNLAILAKYRSNPFEVIGPILSAQGHTGVFVPSIESIEIVPGSLRVSQTNPK